ncbi:Acetyltransferase (GNAT) family protein [Oceanobacillus limi]|uniref:Acetyltransferase (GNAT) family protein n=2 Tax=Oceanobacillus limi TaxID=930131 RepID=A0A1H9YAS4_9BACI|nr:GNAT family N-acetyltransferase [Oceanobacillus limi]SES65945.1 Acetyltransferase (GNAT) family protein [Oceanobacillus limi]
MDLKTKNMTENDAIDILTWKYEKPYDVYNNVLTGDAILELLNGSYKMIVDHEDRIIGIFCIGESAKVPAGEKFHVYEEDCVDVGIGMNPDLTGKGYGYEYFAYILEEVAKKYSNDIRLSVATFNQRAIHLYEKFGFKKEKIFYKDSMEFITMVKRRDRKEEAYFEN